MNRNLTVLLPISNMNSFSHELKEKNTIQKTATCALFTIRIWITRIYLLLKKNIE